MPIIPLRIRQATVDDHKDIVKIAKQSKYTKDYSNMIFSGPDCYEQGRIRVLVQDKTTLGFSCVRKRKRDNVTVLYFIGIEETRRGNGLGSLLLADLEERSSSIELKVMKDNQAYRLYSRRGYVVIEESYEGKAYVMRLQKLKEPR